ncbi:putative lipid II flippase FtsW [Luteococcus peritonei]|uniref:Probable peptidoglycan glycosyltransferase FtsW n=1 Tax=Luteococcus peritonei TaxID=88874 RepID=A0ABW4RQU0_9ACTN
MGEALNAPLASWYLVLVSSSLLVFLGALMVLSASSVYSQSISDNPWYIAQRQLMFLVLGLPLAWWVSRREERTLKTLGWVGFIGALVLLLLVFVPGFGDDAGKGNLAWLKLGPIRIQPSEFAKLGLVAWSAAVIAAKEKVLDRPRELAFPLLVGFALVEILVLAQKDLGTGLVIAAIIFSILFVIGVPGRMLGALGGVGLLGVAFLVITSPNRMKRILIFWGASDADPNASQQPMSAIYALASGGWWGRGLGYSRQKWGNLNDGAQNDFIFAVLGEELGLMGTLAVLCLFAVLCYAGYRIAMRADSIFIRVLAAATTSWLMFQALVNIGVAMKMLPVVGVPLPFISAGGSALLANLLAVALLLACARQEPEARRLRERKAGGPRPRITTVVDGDR